MKGGRNADGKEQILMSTKVWELMCEIKSFLLKGMFVQYLNYKTNQRTNCPVNAHLRSASYTNTNMYIMVFSLSAGAHKALGLYCFRIINILSICQFPARFPFQVIF